MFFTALTGALRLDERGVHVLGQISGGSGFPFGAPLQARQWKYFNYTVIVSESSEYIHQLRIATSYRQLLSAQSSA
jgi:hypothetical protein